MVKEQYTQDPKRLNKTVQFLKKLHENIGTDPEEIGHELGMPRPMVYKRIYDFCFLYAKTVDDDNFPHGLEVFYNRLGYRYPPEIVDLKYLIPKQNKFFMSKAFGQDPSAINDNC